MATIRKFLRGILSLSICATFFLTGWWLRLTRFSPDYPNQPYVLGFLVTLPVLLAFSCWLLLGMPGLSAALRESRRWWLLWLVLLTFWAMISPYWSPYALSAYSASAQFLAVSIFALVVTCAAPPPKWIVTALALGVILLGVVSMGQFYAQRAIGLPLLGEFEINLQRQGVSIVRAGSETILRPYGLQPHPNITAGSLAVGLLALSGWLHGANTGANGHPRKHSFLGTPNAIRLYWRGWVRLAVFGVGLWALLLTFSRAAWIGLVVGAVLIALAWRRPGAERPARGRVRAAVFVSVVLIGLFGVSFARFIWARTGAGGDVTERISIAQRELFYDIAFQLVRSYPLAGVGIGAFPEMARDVIWEGPYAKDIVAEYVHSVPLLALSELGLVGFALWAATTAAGIWNAWRRAFDPYAVGLAAGAAALLVVGIVDHYPWSIFHYGLLLWGCLGAAMSHSASQRQRATEA